MKRFTLAVSLIFVIAAALLGPGWVEEHPTAATALAVGAVFGIIGAALVIGVFLGGVWTARSMRAGADIATNAQKINDEWDAKKTSAFAGLVREGAVIGRQASSQAAPSTALVPLPGQGDTLYLPQLSELPQAGVSKYRDWKVVDEEEELQ